MLKVCPKKLETIPEEPTSQDEKLNQTLGRLNIKKPFFNIIQY